MYIRKLRKALMTYYGPLLEAKSLPEVQIQLMFINPKPVIDVVRSIWFEFGADEAERMWLKMQRETGIKSIGRHSKRWIDLITRFLTGQALDKLTQQIDKTTKDFVTRKLIEASAEGNGIEWLRQQIEGTGLRRARVIARTETIRARNAGYLTAGDELPYQAVKIWSSARDARTRRGPKADHFHMNGQERAIGEYFQDPRSGALMSAPGDSSNETVKGSDVISCRCRITFRPLYGEDGLVLMK